MTAPLTQPQAYDLYRRYAKLSARYTMNNITGKIESTVPPDIENGLTEYNFCGSAVLADFLNFVLRELENAK